MRAVSRIFKNIHKFMYFYYFLRQKLIYRNNLLFSIEKFLLYFLKNLVDSNKT